MHFDPDIHHRRSIRLRNYDYARGGAYFVTVCVQDKACLLGEIANGKASLNEAGRMVQVVWEELPRYYPGASLDSHMVMPNHFHGILFLSDLQTELSGHDGRGELCVRPMGRNNRNKGDHKDRPYGTAPGSLGRIIQAFKSLTTVEYTRGVANHAWPPFPGRLWQRNYYELIIRDEDELSAARKYILENPLKWDLDTENPDNFP